MSVANRDEEPTNIDIMRAQQQDEATFKKHLANSPEKNVCPDFTLQTAPKGRKKSTAKTVPIPMVHPMVQEVRLVSNEAAEAVADALAGLEPHAFLVRPEIEDTEPQTPSHPDFLSPLQSQPSTIRPVGKDTPPPADLTSDPNGTGAGPGGRPSRRARSQVNYAEPNLVSKMRRPTKELFDAVGKDGRPVSGAVVNNDDALRELEMGLSGVDLMNMVRDTGSLSDNVEVQISPSKRKVEYAKAPLRHSVKPQVSHTDNLAEKIIESQRKDALKDDASKPARGSAPPSAYKKALIDAIEEQKRKIAAEKKAALSKSASAPTESERASRMDLSIYDFNDSSPEGPVRASGDPREFARSNDFSRRYSSIADAKDGKATTRTSVTGKRTRGSEAVRLNMESDRSDLKPSNSSRRRTTNM
jgi:hypothetical protein